MVSIVAEPAGLFGSLMKSERELDSLSGSGTHFNMSKTLAEFVCIFQFLENSGLHDIHRANFVWFIKKEIDMAAHETLRLRADAPRSG